MNYQPDLKPESLEAERHRFAAWVVDLAATCRSNDELLSRMTANLPPDFFRLTGEGTTRRCYSTLLGVAVKAQREPSWSDPLTDEEASFRAEPPEETDARRRASNLCELIFATARPKIVPRLYGALLAFGWAQSHPSVLIAETCKPLSHFLPGDRFGVFVEDMGFDAAGQLWIFDKRLTTVKKPADMRPVHAVETKVQLANLGVTPAGRYAFLDRGDSASVGDLEMSRITRCPKEYGWTFLPSAEQDLQFSRNLFAEYKAS